MPPLPKVSASLIKPAMATVSPSLTERTVSTLLFLKEGPAEVSAPGLLTSWAILRVTDPDAEMRGWTMRDIPVSRY